MSTGSSSVGIGSIAALTGHFRAISPDLQRFMAERAHARTVKVVSPHVVMVGHPDAVDRLIETATNAVVVNATWPVPRLAAPRCR